MQEGPSKLSIMRHAESLEDVDYSVRAQMRDEKIPLSISGRAQAITVGDMLNRRLVPLGGMFKIVVSPSKRAIETGELIAAQMTDVPCEVVAVPLLSKQNTGILS